MALTELGKALRDIRIFNGILLKTMADDLGVSPSFLSKVENGKMEMPLTWISKVETLYNIGPEDTYRLHNAKTIQQNSNSFIEGIDFEKLNKDMKEINPRVVHFLISHNRDLTECKGYRSKGIVKVEVVKYHKQWIEQWCIDNLGNRFGFCMGVKTSGNLVDRWHYRQAMPWEIEELELLAEITES